MAETFTYNQSVKGVKVSRNGKNLAMALVTVSRPNSPLWKKEGNTEGIGCVLRFVNLKLVGSTQPVGYNQFHLHPPMVRWSTDFLLV
jgi:hypothetical protein